MIFGHIDVPNSDMDWDCTRQLFTCTALELNSMCLCAYSSYMNAFNHCFHCFGEVGVRDHMKFFINFAEI